MQPKTKDPGLKKSLKGHNDTVTAIDFHPEGTHVVSGSLDAAVLIWKLNAKQVPYKFVGHTGAIHSVAYNPTGTLIATGSADHTVRLWENDSRGVSSTIKSHSGAVRACSFSFDGQYLLTGSDDKYLKIFTVHNRKHASTIAAHSLGIRAAEFSPDSRLIASCSDDKTVKLWDSEQLSPISIFEDDFAVMASRFHPDGTCLASGSADGKVQVWDIRSQMMIQLYTDAHNDAINSLAFHSSGRYLTTASNDSTLKIFDLRKGTLMYSLYGHEGVVQAVNFSKDGSMFGSGGSDSNLILWDSNLNDPEQESEVLKIKKAKKDSVNVDGKSTKTARTTAASKLKKIQNKRKTEFKMSKADDKENEPHSENHGVSKYDTLTENLAGMMDKIASQLDIVTRTVVTLEKRIGDNEDLASQAYDLYKAHQRHTIAKVDRLREQEIRELEELEQQQREMVASNQTDGSQPPVLDFEETRDKVKNIMNIINISQYSLAAVQKSANDIKDTTTQLRDQVDLAENTKPLRDTIQEESEDDFDREV